MLESGRKYETMQFGLQSWLKKLGTKNNECLSPVKQFDVTIYSSELIDI